MKNYNKPVVENIVGMMENVDMASGGCKPFYIGHCRWTGHDHGSHSDLHIDFSGIDIPKDKEATLTFCMRPTTKTASFKGFDQYFSTVWSAWGTCSNVQGVSFDGKTEFKISLPGSQNNLTGTNATFNVQLAFNNDSSCTNQDGTHCFAFDGRYGDNNTGDANGEISVTLSF